MKIVSTFPELIKALDEINRPLGFVPTMGYLHDGHLSLVRVAKEQNESVVVSIFTNPAQFAQGEDLDNYPKDIDRDLKLLGEEGADLVWMPSTGDMYPEGYQTWVEVEELTGLLEGRFRPTHFRGVTTVVAKLFNALRPEQAYFGQKDAQQAAVIKQMVRDLNYSIEIVICPIIRENDGLAMSSRNSYLTDPERKAALCLMRGLNAARKAYLEGENDAENLRKVIRKEIDRERIARVQYISCAHPDTLEELNGDVVSCLLSLSVFIGSTRLIDNIQLPVKG
ncbi:MAG: pantoate--beta-alanine ligase [Anaerolineales bacterium]